MRVTLPRRYALTLRLTIPYDLTHQTVVKYLEDRDLVAACAALAIIEKQSGNVREEVDKLDKLIRR